MALPSGMLLDVPYCAASPEGFGATVIVRRIPGPTAVLLAVAGVVLLALVSAGGDSAVEIGPGWVAGVDGPQEPEPPSTAQEDPETPSIVGSIAAIGLGALLLLFLALVLLGLAAFAGALRIRFGWRTRRHTSSPPIDGLEDPEELPSEPADWMQRAASSALEELLRQRANGAPSDAVVAAWLVLERAAARVGSARKAHQTPTEFTTAVLADHQVDMTALLRLRTLYQRARFGTRASVTAADVATAEEALRQVVDELARSPA